MGVANFVSGISGNDVVRIAILVIRGCRAHSSVVSVCWRQDVFRSRWDVALNLVAITYQPVQEAVVADISDNSQDSRVATMSAIIASCTSSSSWLVKLV